jgi:hypothetical protein
VLKFAMIIVQFQSIPKHLAAAFANYDKFHCGRHATANAIPNLASETACRMLVVEVLGIFGVALDMVSTAMLKLGCDHLPKILGFATSAMSGIILASRHVSLAQAPSFKQVTVFALKSFLELLFGGHQTRSRS